MKSQLRLFVEMSSKQAAVKNIFGIIPIDGKVSQDSAYRVLVEEATRGFSMWKANALMRMKVPDAGAADDGAAEGHDSGGWS